MPKANNTPLGVGGLGGGGTKSEFNAFCRFVRLFD